MKSPLLRNLLKTNTEKLKGDNINDLCKINSTFMKSNIIKSTAILFTALVVLSCEKKKEEAPKAEIEPKVETFLLAKEKLTTELRLPAELTGFQQVDLYAKVSSFVKLLKVDIGSKVKKGQLLIVLEAPEISSQLAAAESRLKSMEAIYATSKSTYNRLYETSKVEGTISKISDKTVEYSLPGETLTISLDVSQIARIDFASGRSQTFDVSANVVASNNTSSGNSGQVIAAAEMKPNTIAVLPVPYVNSGTLESSEEMAKFAQNDLYNKLLDKSSNIFPLTVQDLRVTNSLLHKAGIDYKNIDETPIEDLQRILGVDNIIATKVSYTITEGSVASTYNSGNAKVSDNNKRLKTNDISTTTANDQKYYYYTVYFDMYRNTDKIYSQTRKPLLALKDGWMDSISYLLKRSPIYVKR